MNELEAVRPWNQKCCVRLGSKYGSWDYDYYLFECGEVWCHETPNNPWSRWRWGRVAEETWDKVVVEGKPIRQLVTEACEAGNKEKSSGN